MPCPKSPHGADVDPTGEYIVGGGKLATVIPVFGFSKIQKQSKRKDFIGDVNGIPILKYESVMAGEVQNQDWDHCILNLMVKDLRIPLLLRFFRSGEMEIGNMGSS